MKTYDFNWKEYIKVARRAAAEGSVLIKNDGDVLPLKKDTKIALFGRSQFDYIKSGTGSGGLVNVPYVVNYYDGIKASEDLCLYEPLADVYREWLEMNPFDKGNGWAMEPNSQVEMPVSPEVMKAAADNTDVAVVIIARLCGEDKDFPAGEGAWLLRKDEEELLNGVRRAFDKMIVLINSGDIIDMNWVNSVNPDSVMYIWQGGCEGGNAAADLLSGKVSPSGKLTGTIAYSLEDYPSNANFGDLVRNFYKEDIYVGYRYFETLAPEKVMYPFGYGLSYTKFESSFSFSWEEKMTVSATVKNTGAHIGKEIIQVYMEAPQGMLGKPARVLVGYGKTRRLNPGESDTIEITWGMDEMASYDDTGMTGHRNAFVLEAGEYTFHAGSSIRATEAVGTVNIEDTIVVKETSEALYPVRGFERLTTFMEDGEIKSAYVDTPVCEYDLEKRIADERAALPEIPFTGDKGIKLSDVKEGRASMEDFLAQLTDEEMIIMSRGEGMSSPRVTPGTCAAYGGVADSLKDKGIPASACTDGPSGIRIDSGVMALQGPNGTCLSCTFDDELVKKLYGFLGKELLRDKIDCLLGPGMNIKRHPLNGRNFEYFSEDPLVTGRMAAAQLQGMGEWNTTGCIKHFACNNQENGRHRSDSVVSARALREIYLKGYEIAVKEGGASHIMTTYGSLNGYHTAGNFDLNTMVLRHDWGYKGLVMTDWWAVVGTKEDADPNIRKTTLMIMAQNDVYMVTNSSEFNENKDDSRGGFNTGKITRKELARNAANVIRTVMNTPAYDRLMGEEFVFNDIDMPSAGIIMADVEFTQDVEENGTMDASRLKTDKGAINMITLRFPEKGEYDMFFDLDCHGSGLSQLSATFSINNTVMKVISRNGGNHETTHETVRLGHGNSTERFLKITFSQSGMEFSNIKFKKADI